MELSPFYPITLLAKTRNDPSLPSGNDGAMGLMEIPRWRGFAIRALSILRKENNLLQQVPGKKDRININNLLLKNRSAGNGGSVLVCNPGSRKGTDYKSAPAGEMAGSIEYSD